MWYFRYFQSSIPRGNVDAAVETNVLILRPVSNSNTKLRVLVCHLFVLMKDSLIHSRIWVRCICSTLLLHQYWSGQSFTSSTNNWYWLLITPFDSQTPSAYCFEYMIMKRHNGYLSAYIGACGPAPINVEVNKTAANRGEWAQPSIATARLPASTTVDTLSIAQLTGVIGDIGSMSPQKNPPVRCYATAHKQYRNQYSTPQNDMSSKLHHTSRRYMPLCMLPAHAWVANQ